MLFHLQFLDLIICSCPSCLTEERAVIQSPRCLQWGSGLPRLHILRLATCTRAPASVAEVHSLFPMSVALGLIPQIPAPSQYPSYWGIIGVSSFPDTAWGFLLCSWGEDQPTEVQGAPLHAASALLSFRDKTCCFLCAEDQETLL